MDVKSALHYRLLTLSFLLPFGCSLLLVVPGFHEIGQNDFIIPSITSSSSSIGGTTVLLTKIGSEDVSSITKYLAFERFTETVPITVVPMVTVIVELLITLRKIYYV
jgi:hypothetical protein